MQFFDKYVAAGVSAIEFMEQVSILSIVSKNLKIYGIVKIE